MKGQVKTVLLVGLVFVGLFVAWGVATYNRLIRLNEAVPAAWSQVENVMQRRNDLIPNLVATVKGFAKQEKEVYGQISAALQAFNRAQTPGDKFAADNSISSLLSRIMAVSLNYPQLQSSQGFQQLRDQLEGAENRIAQERKMFNETVQTYNQMVKTFPSNLIAKIGGLHTSEGYFKAEEAAKTAPKVSFE